MFKRILLALVIGSFLVGTAFAGMKEMKEAYASKDYATCISEANKVIADLASSAGDRGLAKMYKGFCGAPDITMTDVEFSAIQVGYTLEYVRCLPEESRGDWTKKSAALLKPWLLNSKPYVNDFYYIYGFMLADLGGQDFLLKLLQKDKVFGDRWLEGRLPLCTQETLKQANMGERANTILTLIGKDTPVLVIKNAYIFLDKLALGTEASLQLLEKIALVVPATPENAEFLGGVLSELKKLNP